MTLWCETTILLATNRPNDVTSWRQPPWSSPRGAEWQSVISLRRPVTQKNKVNMTIASAPIPTSGIWHNFKKHGRQTQTSCTTPPTTLRVKVRLTFLSELDERDWNLLLDLTRWTTQCKLQRLQPWCIS